MANKKTKAESTTATTNSTKNTRKVVKPVNTYPLTLGYGDHKKTYNYTKLVSASYEKLIQHESNYTEHKQDNFDLPITLREMAKDNYTTKEDYIQELYSYFQKFAKSYLAMEQHKDETEAKPFMLFMEYIHKYLNNINEMLFDAFKLNLDTAILDFKRDHFTDIEMLAAQEKKQLQKEYEEAQAAKEENQKEQESEQSGSKA